MSEDRSNDPIDDGTYERASRGPQSGSSDHSAHGAPAVGAVVRDRFSADEVFQRIIAAADEEITSSGRELFFSGLAAGFAITITFLLYSSLTAATGNDPILSALLYPLGFVYIVIGGYQLYTENTLPPVALTLERLASLPALLRHWAVVLVGNFTGAAIGAAALAFGGVFSPESAAAAVHHAEVAIATSFPRLFFKATFAGLIVAGVVWMVYSAQDTISRVVMVYLAFLAIPLASLNHVVISFTEMVYLALVGDVAVATGLVQFVLPVLLGNTFGGMVLVTVVNYYQTSERRADSARFNGAERQLSIREWLFGGYVGRSYVPLVNTSALALARPTADEDAFRVVVPVGDPRAESGVLEFACVLASTHESAVVHAVHVVDVSDRVGFTANGDRERIVATSQRRLEDARETADAYDIAFEASTVASHRSFQEVFAIAKREGADLLVSGWSDDRSLHAGRTEAPIDELAHNLPCDMLVLTDRGFDSGRVLVPTAGGLDSALSAQVARVLQTRLGASVTLLHVVSDPDDREQGEAFLAEWAAGFGLEDATQRVAVSADIEGTIARAAADHSLLLLGAVEAGLLSRLVSGSLHSDLIDEVECSVVLAERPAERSLFERLFARR
jgi:formate-nitrite transporter family protein